MTPDEYEAAVEAEADKLAREEITTGQYWQTVDALESTLDNGDKYDQK